MAASLVAAPCATSRVLVRRLWCLWASSCAALAPEGRLRCSTVSARPETLGGRRGEDLAGADKLRVSEAFAFALGAESIDLEMLRNSGTSDRARRPPATGGAIRPETPRRGRAGRQVRLGGYGRHDWAFSRSGAPMRPPPAYALPAARVVPRGSSY